MHAEDSESQTPDTPAPPPDPPSTDTRSPRRWKPVLEALLTLLIMGLCVAIWMIPKGFSGSTTILGHPDADTVKHYWNLWWFRYMILEENQFPFFTDVLNFPHGLQLFPIELLNNLVALGVGGTLGLPWTTNLLSVFNLAFGGLTLSWLVRALTGSRATGLGAGLWFCLSSYAVWTVYVGVGELSIIGWMPLALLALVKLHTGGGRSALVLGIAAFVLTALGTWYYALFLYMLAAVWMGTQLLLQGRGALAGTRRQLLVMILAMLMVGPLSRIFTHSYPSGDRTDEGIISYLVHRVDSPPHDPTTARLDPIRLVEGGRRIRQEVVKVPYLGGRYLGYVALALSAVGLVLTFKKALPWALMAALSFLMGIGSQLVWKGVENEARLPFFWFNLVLNRFSQPMNFPARFAMPLTLAVAVLVGLGAHSLATRLPIRPGQSRARRLLITLFAPLCLMAAILEVRAVGDTPLPLPRTLVVPLPAATVVAKSPLPGAVVEFPQAFQEMGRRSRDEILLMQVTHQRKSASLPIDRISAFINRGRQELKGQALVASFVHLAMEDPASRMCCENVWFDDPRLIRLRMDLLQRGYRFFILTLTGIPPHTIQALRDFGRQSLGNPVFDSESQVVWEIKERVELEPEQRTAAPPPRK